MRNLSEKIALNLNDNVNVSVKGFIAPIEHTLSKFHEEWGALANLSVAEPKKEYPTSVFQSFLPKEPVSVGECWQINQTGVMKLLRQLNPEPNLNMHIDSGNSNRLWACLRSYNDQFADIAFRIHAEFKLEDGWFTPSQLAGNLTIDQIEEKVAFFMMHLPEGTVNFDVNWHEDKNDDRAVSDAGFCSQMELRSAIENVVANTEYKEKISQEAAERALSLRFYNSEHINWVSPYQAVEMAEEQIKLIHVVSVDGPLADEAC